MLLTCTSCNSYKECPKTFFWVMWISGGKYTWRRLVDYLPGKLIDNFFQILVYFVIKSDNIIWTSYDNSFKNASKRKYAVFISPRLVFHVNFIARTFCAHMCTRGIYGMNLPVIAVIFDSIIWLLMELKA
jgi:hypothetical protein